MTTWYEDTIFWLVQKIILLFFIFLHFTPKHVKENHSAVSSVMYPVLNTHKRLKIVTVGLVQR